MKSTITYLSQIGAAQAMLGAQQFATAAVRIRRVATTALLLAALAGCGGGGTSPTASIPNETIQSPSSVAAQCAAPRTGINPDTGGFFVDGHGTLETEKQWVRAWVHETYLWYNEVPSGIRAADYPTPAAYFADLKTPVITPSGRAKDRFRFTYNTAVWYALSQQGVEAGYGYELSLLRSTPPRDVRVAYVDASTPASALGITRGATLLTADGVDVINGSNVDVINAALFPKAAGETHSFRLRRLDGSEFDLTMTSANLEKQPVPLVKTIATASGKVGYLAFHDHIAPSEAKLVQPR